jgi:predicted aspartyl protease
MGLRMKISYLIFFLTVSAANGQLCSVQAQQPAPAEDILPMDADTNLRMTVPVRLGKDITRNFMVDTGADRSVISQEAASELNMTASKTVKLHTMNGVSTVNTVTIPELGIARTTINNIRAPALPARFLGADGVIGIDSLKNKRITIDFRKSEINIVESTEIEAKDDSNLIVVTAKSRFGQLILVDADIEGRKIKVIVDTGAQNSVGNSALRTMTARLLGNKKSVPISLMGVTGDRTNADYTEIKNIRIGGFVVQNAPVAFADAHPFKRFDLARQPALLLGMDVLRKFDRVSIDFANRKIKFLMPRDGQIRRK